MPVDEAQPAVRYRSLALGHERVMTSLPSHRLAPIRTDDSKLVDASEANATATASQSERMLVETAVFVFVAQRK